MANLHYKGNVKVTINKSIYKKSNNGTYFLFEQFCKWLANESCNAIPEYIDLIALNENGIKLNTCLNSPIRIVTKQSTINTDTALPITLISTTLTSTNLNSVEGDSYQLQLLNNDRDELAFISFDGDLLEQIRTGKDGLIEWSLGLVN